ncbi:MAG: hypothetical protein QNJ23_01030 [Woeseiaceae bacterium]|nr:hypothetical protein [Woeseiaceae bacterium]
MIDLPLVLYIPGLLPKPEPRAHRDALFRCLLAGVRRIDEQVALDIASNLHCFDLVSWTFDFYGEHRDIGIDLAAIEDVIGQPEAADRDLAEASSWRRRLARWVFSIADFMPFLIPHIADERLELHLNDLHRYLRNRNDIADHARQMLKIPLRAAAESGRPVLLIGHSMGSVIAWDSLWQMSRRDGDDVRVDTLLTMGSPLGQRYIQNRLQGRSKVGERRYPKGIGRWINLSAVGDLTSVDPHLANDFAAMVKYGLVDVIEDHLIFNWFRLDGVLNVHAEYGYLVNAVTARIVTDWWKSQRA